MTGEDKVTVLIVDDEPDTCTYFETVLEDHGYATMSASDGEEGLAMVEQHQPDLITLDMSMPLKSGVKLYRELKENDQLRDIPIIIVTGISEDFRTFISSRSQVPPPEGYLSKPINPDEFIDMVKKLTA